jgi:hypothetical protein
MYIQLDLLANDFRGLPGTQMLLTTLEKAQMLERQKLNESLEAELSCSCPSASFN